MMAKPRLALILIPLIFLSSSLIPSYAFHFLITVLYMHPIHRFPISPSVLGKCGYMLSLKLFDTVLMILSLIFLCWYSFSSFCTDTFSYPFVLILSLIFLHWYFLLSFCADTFSYLSVLILFLIFRHWYFFLSFCADTFSYLSGLILSLTFLCWYFLLSFCVGHIGQGWAILITFLFCMSVMNNKEWIIRINK